MHLIRIEPLNFFTTVIGKKIGITTLRRDLSKLLRGSLVCVSRLTASCDLFRMSLTACPGETMWGAILKMDPRTNQLFPQDEMVEVDVLEDDGVLRALHWNFAASLLFGIAHPTEVRTALELERSNMTRNLPSLIEAGLELPANYEPPSVDAYLSECLELTDSFADVRGALAPVPSKLVAEITRRFSQV